MKSIDIFYRYEDLIKCIAAFNSYTDSYDVASYMQAYDKVIAIFQITLYIYTTYFLHY